MFIVSLAMLSACLLVLWMVCFSGLVNGCTALAVLLPQESCTEMWTLWKNDTDTAMR